MKMRLAAVVMAAMLAFMNTAAVGEKAYGPGHETHQYACWDNGDGTHTVACDCGIEKRAEAHDDGDYDGMCDSCGTDLDMEIYEPVVPEGWGSVWNEESGIIFAVPWNMAEWTLNEEDVQDGVLWRGSNQNMTVQLKAYAADELSYADFIGMLDEYEYTVTDVVNVGGTEITVYENPEPGENMQLFGAVLTGTDGRLYKISVFGGDDDDFSEDAAVWELAETFMKTLNVRRFFGWNIYRQRTY